jgi:hypothetical protein
VPRYFSIRTLSDSCGAFLAINSKVTIDLPSASRF